MSTNKLCENVDNAVRRIEKALDSRFEADTTLYISKEDADKIKYCLANNNYQNISAMAAKLGEKVVAKVILKNGWLINFGAIRKSGNKNTLEKIMNGMEDSYFLTIADDVVRDRVYTSLEFKEFIECIYYKKVPIKDCKKYYENENLKIKCRVICFSRYIEKQYVLEHSGTYTVRQIEQVFERHPDIAHHTDVNLLSRIASKIEDKKDVAKWIVENKIKKKTDQLWSAGLLSLDVIGFDASIAHLIKMQGIRDEATRHLIEKIVPKFFAKSDDIGYLTKKVVDLYNDHNEYRYSLIKMLTPSTFLDKDAANKLLDSFEEKTEPSNSVSKFITEIRSWEKSVHDGYKSVEMIREELSGNHDLSNHKTLTYFSKQLIKTDMSLILALYDESDKEDAKLRVILSYFFANCHRRKISVVLESKQFTAGYVDCISGFIESDIIKTPASKFYLEKNSKFDIIAKLFER